ncbi:hypothetical protein O1R50_19660 [Glycomyces luteolus]|uniref:Uncharacterized protein n=1 Tax=Glycomyces luteolus TaxID=2670330 RepID=A0A9X3PBT6_9ACTN|nr:hypothetical protein [Glycomyces luteolus]MDA1361854.1 hypothetical protein [Glycomyces luteolus]
MNVQAGHKAMVVATSFGFTSIFTIVDLLAKHLGMVGATITSERGGGRVIAIWHCSADIASEARLCRARIANEINHPFELEIFLNATGRESETFGD